MGGSCCTGAGTVHPSVKDSPQNKDLTNDVESRTRRRATTYQSISFDVIVPNRGSMENSGAMLGVASSMRGRRSLVGTLGMEPSASFTAFDQTMYTMRGDANVSFLNQSMLGAPNFDSNLSFTNNFLDVNKDAVRTFLNSVETIAEGSGRTRNMLEESVLVRSGSAKLSSPTDTSSLAKIVGANQDTMTQEDIEYINGGATFQEKIERLSEVEEVLRDSITGTWRMNSALIQLALTRVVPTLRQRRKYGNVAAASASPAGAGNGFVPREKRPVVIVHAQGLEVDRSSAGSSTPQGGQLTPGQHDETSITADAQSLSTQTQLQRGGSMRRGGPMDPLNRSMTRSNIDPTSATVEHYELLALTCRAIDVRQKCRSKVVQDSWDFLSDEENVEFLNEGGCVFRFVCEPLPRMDKETIDCMSLFVNLSSFADEVKENNAPRVDPNDPEDAAKYIGIGVKAMYMLPGVKLANVRPETISSYEYQSGCQPRANKTEECKVPNTFRLVMSVVKYVFSLTVMFRVSEITDPHVLLSLKAADGIVPGKAILLERTKRDVSKVDATAKVRSLLLYYPVNGGLLCNSHTFVLNTSIPKLVAKLVNTFGSQGASQSAETTELTRKYMIATFGDSRKE